jgi:hypothetical protein
MGDNSLPSAHHHGASQGGGSLGAVLLSCCMTNDQTSFYSASEKYCWQPVVFLFVCVCLRDWDLNSGLCVCKANALPFEQHF